MDYVANPSRLGRYLKDPRSLYYYANKATRNPRWRAAASRVVRTLCPAANTYALNNKELELLKRDGIVMRPQLISPETVQKILAFLSGRPVFGFRDLEARPVDLASADPLVPHKLKYFPADMVQCPEIVGIANDERIISLVSAYFGCKPTIACMEVWWTLAGKQPPAKTLFQDDMFHRDAEDFKFAKLFIYLTDVVRENGAHCFIKGTHRSSKLVARGPVADDVAANQFPLSDQLVITGKAGDGFIEDTWGLHRSLPAAQGRRLLLSITYCLTAFNPQTPKAPPGHNSYGVDPYTNRAYLA